LDRKLSAYRPSPAPEPNDPGSEGASESANEIGSDDSAANRALRSTLLPPSVTWRWSPQAVNRAPMVSIALNEIILDA